MAATATNRNENAGRTDRDVVTDQCVVARMFEMRDQGYSFRDIAPALAKQGLITLSPECVKATAVRHDAKNVMA
jgi:hypothetical protein